MLEQQKYDVVILGAGPGGYVCALDCARLGLRTALVESGELGGTCLNRGCVPTKTLLQSADLFHETLDAAKFGVNVENVSFDYGVANARREKIVAQLRQGIKTLEKTAGVDVLFGRGELTSANSLCVKGSDGTDVELLVEKIVLATGSYPVKPPVPGLDLPEVWTSDDVLKAERLPESVVIVGGGVIGIEFATLFGALGKKATVLEALPGILPNVDPELTKLLMRKLKKLKIDVKTSVRVTNVDADSAFARVSFEEKGATQTAEAERCVVCVGRKPATRNLGLENVGVELDARGFVVVDEFMRTNVPNILAIGDVSGKVQLAHVASEQGRVAARVCAGDLSVAMRYDVVPSCVYTSPEIAAVGLTEDAARQSGLDVTIGSFRVPSNARAMAAGADVGLIKLVSETSSGKILGAQILAPRATDMIAELALAIQKGTTMSELASTIHPHPTFCEAIADAARSVL